MLGMLGSRLNYTKGLVAIVAVMALSGTTAAAATVIITSNSQVAAHTIAGAKGAAGLNKNIIPGSLAGSDLANGTVTAANIAAANRDGTAGTPSLRTLGNGAQQAVAGNDPRLTRGLVGTNQIARFGPLPISTNFVVKKAASELLITWSGTAFRNGALGAGLGCILLTIDGGVDGTCMYVNNTFLHMAFPTRESVISGLSPGTHTIGFDSDSLAPVSSDDQDRYYYTIVEVQPNP